MLNLKDTVLDIYSFHKNTDWIEDLTQYLALFSSIKILHFCSLTPKE